MGLLDRDYYRDDQSGPLGNWFRYGRITKILAIVYVLAFVLQIISTRPGVANAGPITESLSLSGEQVLRGQVWRLATYGILHTTDSLWYIAFNVVVLYVFGRELEERIGARIFLLYYVSSVVVAGLVFLGVTAAGLNGTSRETSFVGATGAISALLLLVACQEPRHRVMLFFVLPVPIWIVILLHAGVDTWGMLGERLADDGRRVALALHLGGAMCAGLFFLRNLRLSGRWARGSRVLSRSQPRVRVYHEEAAEEEPTPTPVAAAAAREADEHLEAQLDAVLAKVAQQGKDSLTPSEQAILKRASEIYRKRRK